MSTMERLLAVFQRVFEDEVDISNVREESRLVEDLGLSSIAMLYMALALEEEFGIKLSNEDLPKLKTVADVAFRVER